MTDFFRAAFVKANSKEFMTLPDRLQARADDAADMILPTATNDPAGKEPPARAVPTAKKMDRGRGAPAPPLSICSVRPALRLSFSLLAVYPPMSASVLIPMAKASDGLVTASANPMARRCSCWEFGRGWPPWFWLLSPQWRFICCTGWIPKRRNSSPALRASAGCCWGRGGLGDTAWSRGGSPRPAQHNHIVYWAHIFENWRSR